MTADGPPTLPPELQERLDRMGLEFLAELLGRATARHPHNLEALSELATVLTRLGRFEEGLAADRELVRRCPGDPTVQYNLACSLALLGRSAEALTVLERAVELGYGDQAHLLADEDLASLRDERRFRELVARLSTE